MTIKTHSLTMSYTPKVYTSILKFKVSDVELDNIRLITKNNVMKRFQQESKGVGDQIFFQTQDEVNCFNLVNKIIE